MYTHFLCIIFRCSGVLEFDEIMDTMSFIILLNSRLCQHLPEHRSYDETRANEEQTPQTLSFSNRTFIINTTHDFCPYQRTIHNKMQGRYVSHFNV